MRWTCHTFGGAGRETCVQDRGSLGSRRLIRQLLSTPPTQDAVNANHARTVKTYLVAAEGFNSTTGVITRRM